MSLLQNNLYARLTCTRVNIEMKLAFFSGAIVDHDRFVLVKLLLTGALKCATFTKYLIVTWFANLFHFFSSFH